MFLIRGVGDVAASLDKEVEMKLRQIGLAMLLVLCMLIATSLGDSAAGLGGAVGPAKMYLKEEVPFLGTKTVERTLRLRNTDQDVAALVELGVSGDLEDIDTSFSENGFTIPPGQEKEISVKFKLIKTGVFRGDVVVTFSGTDSALEGSGATGNLVLLCPTVIQVEGSGMSGSLIGGMVGGVVVIIAIIVGLLMYRGRRKARVQI